MKDEWDDLTLEQAKAEERRALLRIYKETKASLDAITKKLGQDHGLFWTDSMGWVTIPEDLE